ncbi:HD domain-containing protein [Roseibium polysiphoniae]|uniref:HD domain-containing protein n=1 Tax=Roseibium polysiphoniae TaxID=2571221 RepID=A0ABR9CCS7_9HYPH|nr:HD domain-containing protein [Roseibium polysiphoniae]MBD8877433.1 HD domain-containing protein [Roseibium polysiphoniae]
MTYTTAQEPSSAESDRLARIIDFIQAAEALKDTLRSGRTGQGRAESTAEHTWRLCLMTLLFEADLADIDVLKLLKICVIHDLAEAISGDVPAPSQSSDDGRAARERQDLLTLCKALPEDLSAEVVALWDEYAEAKSPEAILAKGFDKIETMLQHVKGRNAPDFDYAFNLGYGREATDRHPLLRNLRLLADNLTQLEMISQAGE